MIYQDPKHSIPERINDLIGQMTLQEKLAQIGAVWVHQLQDGAAFSKERAGLLLKHGIGQITRLGGASLLAPVERAEMANAIQSHLARETRLGIPAILHEECCNGYMAQGATVFPQMLGLASAWQPELAEQMSAAIGKQIRGSGAHQGLAPVLDLGRDPRWGRIEETFGEDPLLVAQMGMAYVRGLQGPDLHQGVMATGKHFIGHSLSHGGLNCGPVSIGPRELRESLMGPFEAAIREAGLATIMNSYPELDGSLVAASKSILTDLLREELGFTGLVVSDYEAIQMIHSYHRIAKDQRQAARLALEAGIETELPVTQCYGEPLCSALLDGEVDIRALDNAVCRVLEKKFELGLFENPYVDTGRVGEIYSSEEPARLAGQIARQSLVLLKNEGGALPLAKTIQRLAVIGPNADDSRSLFSDYSYPAMLESMLSWPLPYPKEQLIETARQSAKAPSVLDAIRERASGGMQVEYAQGCAVNGTDRSGFGEALRIAEECDLAILVLGDRAGMTLDCTCGETRDSADLALPGVQEELARAVIGSGMAQGKPVVVVLINGRPLAIPWIVEHAQAILEAWLPGQAGAEAIAAALFGEVNPGGKLPISFPRSAGQLPLFYNHKPSGRHSNWFHDYVSLSVQPLFTFGHGLSYTSFEYSQLEISPAQARPGDRVQISLSVRNSGSCAGEEVVQLYLCDEYASLPRPVKELKGFKRICLQPGEQRRLTFDLAVDQLAFYNEDLRLVVEPGDFQVMLGSSSSDVRLAGRFEVVGEAYAVPRRIFTCPVEIQ